MQLRKAGSDPTNEWKTFSINKVIGPGSYELQFTTPTQMNKDRLAVRVTIVMADQQFYQDTYLKNNAEALIDCSENLNLPLALTKDTKQTQFEDEQVFDYPLLRLGGKTIMSDYILDSFNFRVNETSHFHFSLGSHLLTSHVVLRLSELREYGNAQIGMQQF